MGEQKVPLLARAIEAITLLKFMAQRRNIDFKLCVGAVLEPTVLKTLI